MQKKRRGEGSFHRINACMYILVEQSSEKEDKNVDRGGGRFIFSKLEYCTYTLLFTQVLKTFILYIVHLDIL